MRGHGRFIAALLSFVAASVVLAPAPSSAAVPTTALTGILTGGVKNGSAWWTIYTAAGGTMKVTLPDVPPNTAKQRQTAKAQLNAGVNHFVRLTGKQHTNDFTAFSAWVFPLPANPPEPPPLPVKGKLVAVVAVNWAGAGAVGAVDPNVIRNWMFSDATSVTAFYKATSNNSLQLFGNAFSVTLPGTDGSASCIPSAAQLNNPVNAKLGSLLNTYNYVVFVPQFTPATDCTTAGVTQGGKTIVISGSRTKQESKFKATTAHEIGHALGLMHAGFTPCPPPGNGFGCTTYGDWFDPMGDEPFGLPQFSALHKWFLGFLPGSATTVVPAHSSGDYLLRASDAPGAGGTRQLLVQRGGSVEFYSLEVRGAGGTWAPYTYADPIANGVTIRQFWLDRRPEFADSRGSADSVVVDASSSQGRFIYDDAALPFGNTWTDPGVGIAITTVWAGFGWAQVHISVA